jgi:hypothetical protein
MRLVLSVLLCAGFLLARVATGQSCGVWLPGPSTPDLPPGANVVQLEVSGSTMFARVGLSGSPGTTVWRYSGGLWANLNWDAAAMGSADTLSTRDGLPAVGSARITGQSGDFNVWQIAVWVHDGNAWNLEVSGTRTYFRETAQTRQVNVAVLDLVRYGGLWHLAGRLSASNIIGFSSSGILYRFPAAGLEVLATTESAGCTFCLNPRSFHALLDFNGQMYLGGSFSTIFPGTGGSFSASNLVRWDGAGWQTFAQAPNGVVRGLSILPSLVGFPLGVVYGDFSQVGTLAAARIALYQPFTNSWSALGSGLGNTPAAATSVAGTGGPLDIDLVVAGVADAGGIAVDGYARWTGSAWQEFGDPGTGGIVSTAATLSGAVIAGGTGMSSGGTVLYGVARWNGSAWTHLGTGGTNSTVHALFQSAGDVYAGGEFTTIDGVGASRIARRTGTGWQPLGSGVAGTVRAITSFAGEVIAGGLFASAGGSAASNIAAWNGSSWRALGNGLNGEVRALTVWNNRLVAVGAFTASGAGPMTGAAQWDGAAWTVIDPAFALTGLRAATVHNGDLYVGGDEPADVRRLNAGSFQVVGGGVTGDVFALASLAGSLYVGGNFTAVGAGLNHRRIARWTGSQWLGLNQQSNDFTFGEVRSLTPATDQLFVAGSFQVNTTGGFVTNATRWNGVNWLPLPTGSPDAAVLATALQGSRFWIGGGFAQVGSILSVGVAQWSPTPVFSDDPESVVVCDGGGTQDAAFAAAIHDQAGVTLRWHRNGQPLSDGLRVSGSTTPALTIFAVVPADAGAYTCVATDACAQTTASAAADLVVEGPTCNPPCDPDYNQDGNADQDDVAYLVNVIAGGENPTGRDPDFNLDGNVDQEDYIALVNVVAGGPCP